MDPTVELVEGFPAMMPTYQGVLANGEAAAIVEFIKTLSDADQTLSDRDQMASDEDVDLGAAPVVQGDEISQVSQHGLTTHQPQTGALRPTVIIGVRIWRRPWRGAWPAAWAIVRRG